MKQVLMEFLRCAAFLKCGRRCHYKAKYNLKGHLTITVCGHHRGWK